MEQPIRFENHLGEALAGTLNLPDAAPAFGVVLGHCFTCSRHTSVLRQIAQGLEASGNASLRFDFSGNGQSEGLFAESTYSKQIAEMKAAVELLRARGIGRIGLAGHSLGAVVALLTASEMPAAIGVCAIAGRLSGLTPFDFLDPRQKAQVEQTGRVKFTSRGRNLEITRRFFSDAGQYRLAERVAALKTPLLLVHGDLDDVVSLDESRRARQLKPENTELAVIAGADHMFSREEHRVDVARRVVAWFVRQAAIDPDPPSSTIPFIDR